MTLEMRFNWTYEEVAEIFERPLMDLLLSAQQQHRKVFPANAIEQAHIVSVKTGACPEDCTYCSQSIRYDTEVEAEPLWEVDKVVEAAKAAKAEGATRFCMGAAWRSPKRKNMDQLVAMIKAVKALDMETCFTLGMLSEEQVKVLDEAGLDYYNHNLDTAEEFYPEVITTRKFQDRLDTIGRLRKSNIRVCCGGILGLGESREHRINFLRELAHIEPHPESLPINRLIPVKGTPLEDGYRIDDLEFVRTIAVARLMMPNTVIRLTAGREAMSDTFQTLCFMAGASSIFMGELLLTEANPRLEKDNELIQSLGMKKMNLSRRQEPVS